MDLNIDFVSAWLDSLFKIYVYRSQDTSFSKREALFSPEILMHVQPDFRRYHNGLMLKNSNTAFRLAATCFLCDEFVAELQEANVTDTLVITHHMLDIDAGTPNSWNARGFSALSVESFQLLKARCISVYVLHLPLDANASAINTHAALCRQLSLEPVKPLLIRPGYDMGYMTCASASLYETVNMRFSRSVSFGNLPINPRRAAVLAGMVGSVAMLEEIRASGCDLLVCGDVLLRQNTPRAAEILAWLQAGQLPVLCLSHKETEEPALRELLDRMCKEFSLSSASFFAGGNRWK